MEGILIEKILSEEKEVKNYNRSTTKGARACISIKTCKKN